MSKVLDRKSVYYVKELYKMNPKKFIYINSVSILLEHFKYNNCTTLILFE